MRNRAVKIPGVGKDAERVLSDLLTQVDDRLALLERKTGRAGLVTTDAAAKPGEFLNIEAPSDGLTIILPQATPALRNARVALNCRNGNPVRIVALLGLVNSAQFVVNDARGKIEAVCNGLDGWECDTVVTEDGNVVVPAAAALDAEYLLGASHGSLPNGRVATDSAEIDADLTVANVVSWALRTASVALAKLQDLTGLSVLGRAATSAGVMSAITATLARQVLRVNDTATGLEWGDPVEVRDSGVDQGDAYALNFVAGTNCNIAASVAFGVATITPSVDDYPLSGLADQAAHTFVGNITGSAAPPTANSLATLAGDYLTYNNAGGINWAGAGILDNAGAVLGTQGQILQGLDSTTIIEDWAFSVDTAALRYNVNQAAAFTWTGIHRHDNYVTFGDPGSIATGDIRKNSQLDISAAGIRLATLAGGGELDLGTGSTGEAELGGEHVRLRADQNVYVVSGTSGNGMGHLVMIGGASGNTPATDEGEYWVDDTTVAQTLPGFTDDDNIDHNLAYAYTKVQAIDGTSGAAGTIALNDNTTVVRWAASGGAINVDGFSGRLWHGRRLLLRNANATGGNTVTLNPEAAAATSTHRMVLAGTGSATDASRTKVVRSRGQMAIVYDATSTRWFADAI